MIELPSELGPRFWEKVQKTEGCWNWTSATDEKGYPLFWKDRACRRLAAIIDVPDGLQLSHLCGNKRCVRPEHIIFETPGQNKQRDPGPGRPRPCPRGHRKTFRVYRQDNGKTRCTECSREYANEHRRQST